VIVLCIGASACMTRAPAPTSSGMSKQTFILRLVGFCAGVNERLATPAKNNESQAGRTAQELEGMVHQVMSSQVPNEDRQQFDAMISALLDAASKQRAVEVAQASKQQSTIDRTTKQATDAINTADAAAVAYGMPHLKDCGKKPSATGEAGAGATWRQGQNAPIGVQQAATAVLDGRIWLFGGLTDGKASKKVMVYDATINSWTLSADLPVALHHAMAVSYRGEPIVMGGFIPQGSNVSAISSDRVYRLHGGHWIADAPLGRGRAAGAAAVVGDKIVLVGGRDSRPSLIGVTEVFDGTRWRDAAAMPEPGDHLAAVSDGSALYAVGGANLSPDRSSPALQRFDPAANTWKRLPDMPGPRGGLGAALVDGRIIAVGGADLTSVSTTVESYDMASGTWGTLASLLNGTHGAGVAAVNDVLYTIDGGNRPGHSTSMATVQELDLARQTSTSTSASTSPATPTTSPARSRLDQCPTRQSAKWACLTSAVLLNGKLVIAYRTNFTPSKIQDAAHFHMHFFTARPDNKGGTIPRAATLQMHGGSMEGSWFIVYSKSVKTIDSTTERGGRRLPLDTTHNSLLCVRVATGAHDLAKDRSGGDRTGNCVRIIR
jgi:N-acetylneuraminic acid mutarotase